jgi:hypothetical protein
MLGIILVPSLLIALNLAIGTWNAYAVGQRRTEAALMGEKIVGFEWLVINSARWTSVACFTIPIVILLGLLVPLALPKEYIPSFVKVYFGAFYVAIAVPVTACGLIITLHSIKEAFRPQSSYLERGIAVWNTGASIHNMVELATTLPKTFSMIGEGLSAAGKFATSGDGDSAPLAWGGGAAIAIGTLVAALLMIATCGAFWIVHRIERWGMASVMNGVGVDKNVRQEARA